MDLMYNELFYLSLEFLFLLVALRVYAMRTHPLLIQNMANLVFPLRVALVTQKGHLFHTGAGCNTTNSNAYPIGIERIVNLFPLWEFAFALHGSL